MKERAKDERDASRRRQQERNENVVQGDRNGRDGKEGKRGKGGKNGRDERGVKIGKVLVDKTNAPRERENEGVAGNDMQPGTQERERGKATG